jgi:hemoglobin
MRSSISRRLTFIPFILVCLATGVGAAAAQNTGDGPSLFDRLGGLEAIAIVVDDFMTAFVQDPVVMANPAVRERKTPERLPYITYQVTTVVCEVTGGPCRYEGATLAAAHAGLNVSAEEWNRMGSVFAATLDRHAVPEAEQEELLAILGGTRSDIVVSDR